MTFTDLQATFPELNPYRIDQISAQVARYMKLNERLRNTLQTVCHSCREADVRFIKKGFQAGKKAKVLAGLGKASQNLAIYFVDMGCQDIQEDIVTGLRRKAMNSILFNYLITRIEMKKLYYRIKKA